MTVHERPDRTIDRFSDEATDSFTLAASMYTDPAVLQAERDAIFHRSWIYVGHRSQVVDPGDYLTAEIMGQHVFVIRAADGELRAFFNVCLHRGHALLEGTGTVGRLISCPYHGWAYNPDGGLQGARMADRMSDFNFEDYRLPSVAVEDFCGFVFVNLDPDPPSMMDTYPGAAEAVREMVADPGGLLPVTRASFSIAGNWKNVADNLLECYHCHTAHPGFVDVIEMDTYRNDTFTNWSVQAGTYRSQNDTYTVDSGSPGFTSLFLWPNLSIGRIPGLRGLLIFTFLPSATEHTEQTVTVFTPDGTLTESEDRAVTWFNEVLGPEDVALVESVQVGLNSLGYHQGRFICIPDRPELSEHAVHHFHQMVRQALASESG